MVVKFTAGPSGLVRIWIPPTIRGGGNSFMDENENRSHSAAVPETSLDSAGGTGSDSTLDYRAEVETGSPPKNRITRFGTNARRRLREAGAVMDSVCADPSEAVFLTGTIPSVEPAAWAAIATYSSWVVHRLKAWVNKFVPGKLDFYVWEWQARGALHIHYCCHIPNPEARGRVLRGFHDRWVGWLRVVGEMAGVRMFVGRGGVDRENSTEVVQAYAVEVEKSVGGYLSKYLGKGTSNSKPPGADFFYPVRWWGVSRPLLAEVRERTVEGELRGSGRNDATVYEECISSAGRVAETVYEWKNRVVGGSNAAAVFSDSEAALQWLDEIGEGIMPKKVGVEPRANALDMVKKVEVWAEKVELRVPGHPRGMEARAAKALGEIMDYTSTALDYSGVIPYSSASTILYELLMLTHTVGNLMGERVDKVELRRLRAQIISAKMLLKPLVLAELMSARVPEITDPARLTE